MSVQELVDFLKSSDCPQHNKKDLVDVLRDRFALTRDKSVYYGDSFALRVSSSKSTKFGNTVLALSSLQKYDRVPFLVILVSAVSDIKVLLANSTFLKRISHSSHNLRVNNICGSFNVSDVYRDYAGVPNDIDHLDELFAFHVEMPWKENLIRLVEATNQIEARVPPYIPTDEELVCIKASVRRAEKFIKSREFKELQHDLTERTQRVKDCIYIASRIENVNIRGRLVEILIMAEAEYREVLCHRLREAERESPVLFSDNKLGDYERIFDGIHTYTDIKTKIIYLDSNPKAFNVDKFLKCMGQNDSVFLFFFVGIDENGVLNTRLCSAYQRELVSAYRVQAHLSGRLSRGTTLLLGKTIADILSAPAFNNVIDEREAEHFLDCLLTPNPLP